MRKIIAAGILAFLCCGFHKARAQARIDGVMPHMIVYKTKKDYSRFVPIVLSDDKKKVISYPDPRDCKRGNIYPYPARLHKGYFLDEFGVGKNTVFLNMTFEEYSRLKSPPPIDSLFNMISDKNPIKEVCDCGKRFSQKDAVEHLNKLIDANELRKTCRNIK